MNAPEITHALKAPTASTGANMVAVQEADSMAVVADRDSFDKQSGNILERLIFNNRAWVVLSCVLLTVFFAFQLRGLTVTASYDKMLPLSHPYIQNFLANRGELRGLGESVRVAVENPRGDIFNKEYLATLGKINDEIFLLPGVDRALDEVYLHPGRTLD